MGSWGTGPFDNDTAADLLAFVEEAGARGWSLVREALESTYPQDVVAAGEIVATAMGMGTRRDQRTLAFAVGRQKSVPWVRRYGHVMPADLPSLALDAVRIYGKAFSRRHADTQYAREWNSTVRSLIRRLERGARRRRS